MRIVTTNEQKLFIITPDNDVCSFIGGKPAQHNPLRALAPLQKRATIAQSFIAACSSFAENLHRAARR